MEMVYVAELHTKGFEIGQDITKEEFEKLKEQFVQMNNIFADYINQALPKINEVWEQYELIREKGDLLALATMHQIMEIDSSTEYGDWLEKYFKEIANCVDLGFNESRLISNIFKEDGMPIYGVKIKGHQNWEIDMTLKQIELA